MGNYHILNNEAEHLTVTDTWYAVHTEELPSSISIKSIHLSELLHKEERLDLILPLSEVIEPKGLLSELLSFIALRSSRLGVWADTNVSTDQIDILLKVTKDANYPLVNNLDLIVLYQPSFVDGRSFSQARHLRQQGFEGEIRIAGHFGRDQIAYLKRAGVDSFIIADENLGDDIVNAFNALPSSYDGVVADQLPMFR
ncbi:DUF934 domain-containing protein [Psychrobacter sp.]|uniref:DUF934 domain-containing protein n=1 Tax=Psychrobacter sp. TaxID=56811 RepID=UPI0025D625D7|nr:DUF934 domain-containing protein [Psychrobacter sp.]